MQICGSLRGHDMLNDGIVRAFDSMLEGSPELVERYELSQQQERTSPLFQPVYHGSGASFGAFDSAYMGTGEGNQAFGWEHYVMGALCNGE